jgi:phosphoribosyl 1,2-cyclic phosphodiesterase
MIITFYGVRGSTPTPGPTTVKYGGNTSCVHLQMNNGQDIIFDAGTGMRILGMDLMKKPDPISIILSHGHWDHIQGYPFFVPIYQPDREIDVFTTAQSAQTLLESLSNQMEGINFPIHTNSLLSRRSYYHENNFHATQPSR